ncbi:MAG: DNA alkylation repair protein [Bacteroidetes bacterium]|nr:MAG: DNA alkylation repair protein [Bacteroidota bacterium]
MLEEYIKTLELEFEKNANQEIAIQQKAYLKNQFDFYGIKTPLRREIQKPFFESSVLPKKDDLGKIIKILWEKPEREYQYFSQELLYKYHNKFDVDDIKIFEYMITHKSWWDTVDLISSKLVGEYFKIFPSERNKYINKWLSSNNMWLQRASVLFQLGYKKELDTDLLSYIINSLLGSSEFFINKSIGWILRQYSRVNPKWVVEFVEKTELDKLSVRESLRLIK